MKVEYPRKALKQLDKLPIREVKKVLKKIGALGNEVVEGKMLRGEFAGFYSLRVWPYRIIYKVIKKTIAIVSIAHRQGVYK